MSERDEVQSIGSEKTGHLVTRFCFKVQIFIELRVLGFGSFGFRVEALHITNLLSLSNPQRRPSKRTITCRRHSNQPARLN